METPKKPQTWNADVSTYSTPAQPESPSLEMPVSTVAKDKTTTWTWISILFSAIILSNSIICTMLLCHVAFISQDTRASLLLLSSKLDFISIQRSMPGFLSQENGQDVVSNLKKGLMEPEAEMLEELKDTRTRPALDNECPVCPPCHPDEGIPTNKDPVSFINMLFGSGATYTCKTVCLNPPIHIATLSITAHSKTWEGKGSTKKRSKKEAAFVALNELNKTLADEAVFAPEHYNPVCKSRIYLAAAAPQDSDAC